MLSVKRADPQIMHYVRFYSSTLLCYCHRTYFCPHHTISCVYLFNYYKYTLFQLLCGLVRSRLVRVLLLSQHLNAPLEDYRGFFSSSSLNSSPSLRCLSAPCSITACTHSLLCFLFSFHCHHVRRRTATPEDRKMAISQTTTVPNLMSREPGS